VLTPFIGVAGVQRLVYPARSRRAVIAQYPLAGGFGRWRAARWPHQFAVRLAHRSTSARTSAFDISPSRRLFQAGKISTVKTHLVSRKVDSRVRAGRKGERGVDLGFEGQRASRKLHERCFRGSTATEQVG
jgi:hypothetical protein